MTVRLPVYVPRPVALTVDGSAVEVPEGSTILVACRALGVDTPTLCQADNLRPVNACRVCVVELEGARTLVPACSRRVEPGMKVRTDSPRVRHARRLVLELLGSGVDLDRAPRVRAWMERYGADPSRFGSGPAVATVAQPVKDDNALYVRDYARCILCYKCVEACGEEAQGTFAIAVAGRGYTARIATEFDVPLTDSACVYCGNCIGVCPTGALVFKTEHALRSEGAWDEARQTRADTVCPYCGVGCTLTLHAQDGRIVKATSPAENEVTRGHLCIKGRFGWRFVQGDE